MAKFYDVIGYGISTEVSDGVWVDVITERKYYGDEKRLSRVLRDGEHLNSDITVQTSISIMADAYAYEHFFAIRYIKWAGTLWTVSHVEVQRPRLNLRLGGVYNGPTIADNPPEEPPVDPGGPDDGDGDDG